MNLLVTGATGFIGVRACAYFLEQGLRVRAAVRRPCERLDSRIEQHQIDALGPQTDWSSALTGIDAVVHLASRVHVMRETAADPLSEFRNINVEGTRRLAQMAAEAGVQRLVYLSTIKVNGEHTAAKAFRADDPVAPQDPYGQSKWEAEQALHEIGHQSDLESVIIRPPLVYGAGVKGNLRQLMRIIRRGVPLPLAGIHNRRTLIGRDNLISLIASCLQHPAAANQTFLAGDARPLSTPELIRRIAQALDASARLFPFPTTALRTAAKLTGQGEAWKRLSDNLEIDLAPTRQRLNWTPPYGIEHDLHAMASAFLDTRP